MVDKLFFRGELFALRYSFKNLLMLCPILIRSLFYEGFYANDGLDFPLAHGHRFSRPTHLGSSDLSSIFILFNNTWIFVTSLRDYSKHSLSVFFFIKKKKKKITIIS